MKIFIMMCAKTKNAARRGAKIVASFLFVLLVMFNIKIGMNDSNLSGISSLLGLSVGISTPAAIADGSCCPYQDAVCGLNGANYYNKEYRSGSCSDLD